MTMTERPVIVMTHTHTHTYIALLFSLSLSHNALNPASSPPSLVLPHRPTQSHSPTFPPPSPCPRVPACRLEPTFLTDHNLILIHVWCMHTRLKAEGPQWETLEERVFDQLWMDTMKRIRHEGINELSVNKYLNETQQASFGTLVSYDHALENADNRDVLDEAIWRSVFERDDHADERDVRRMSDYVRREVSDMLRRDLQDVVWGNVKWGAPPTKRRTGSRKKRGVDSGAGAAVGAVAGVAEGSTGETAETGEAEGARLRVP